MLSIVQDILKDISGIHPDITLKNQILSLAGTITATIGLVFCESTIGYAWEKIEWVNNQFNVAVIFYFSIFWLVIVLSNLNRPLVVPFFLLVSEALRYYYYQLLSQIEYELMSLIMSTVALVGGIILTKIDYRSIIGSFREQSHLLKSMHNITLIASLVAWISLYISGHFIETWINIIISFATIGLTISYATKNKTLNIVFLLNYILALGVVVFILSNLVYNGIILLVTSTSQWIAFVFAVSTFAGYLVSECINLEKMMRWFLIALMILSTAIILLPVSVVLVYSFTSHSSTAVVPVIELVIFISQLIVILGFGIYYHHPDKQRAFIFFAIGYYSFITYFPILTPIGISYYAYDGLFNLLFQETHGVLVTATLTLLVLVLISSRNNVGFEILELNLDTIKFRIEKMHKKEITFDTPKERKSLQNRIQKDYDTIELMLAELAEHHNITPSISESCDKMRALLDKTYDKIMQQVKDRNKILAMANRLDEELLTEIKNADDVSRPLTIRLEALQRKLAETVRKTDTIPEPPKWILKTLQKARRKIKFLEKYPAHNSSRVPQIVERIPEIKTTETSAEISSSSSVATEDPITDELKEIKVTRGYVISGGTFQYKVKIENNTSYVITDVGVSIISYPEDCMELGEARFRKISKIEPKGFRSLEFTLIPTKDCVKGAVLANVSFVDHTGKMQSYNVEPQIIRSVCDLLIPLKTSLSQFYDLLDKCHADGTRKEERIEQNVQSMYHKIKSTLPSMNFHIIHSESNNIGGQFFGTVRASAKGKYNRNQIILEIIARGFLEEDECRVTISACGDNPNMLPITIVEMIKEFRKDVRQLKSLMSVIYKNTASLMDAAGESQQNQDLIMKHLKNIEAKTDANSLFTKDFLTSIHDALMSAESTSKQNEIVLQEILDKVDFLAEKHKLPKKLRNRISGSIRSLSKSVVKESTASLLWGAVRATLIILGFQIV